MTPFGTRLAAAIEERGRFCVGIDPHAGLLREWGLDDDVASLALPVMRWHPVQWQAIVINGGPVNSNRILPQRHWPLVFWLLLLMNRVRGAPYPCRP